MTDPDPAAATAAAVYAVSLKLPTFLASRPDVWFQQTEAQFALRNITDSTTKYFYLLTSLDPVVAERMAGDVAAVPTDGLYGQLDLFKHSSSTMDRKTHHSKWRWTMVTKLPKLLCQCREDSF